MRYAQTNIQLLGQLQAAGYAEDDLLLVDRSYRIGMRLFAGQYRPNNKPFLAHLVGVGSILATSGQEAAVIAAGLLHSAYALGLGIEGSVKPRYRKHLQGKLGADVERLVHAYCSRRWSADDFVRLAADPGSLAVDERPLWLIKLADVHEEFLDGGHRYAPRKKLLHDEETRRGWLDAAIELAGQLGSAEWAEAFRQDVDAGSPPTPDSICSRRRSSFILAPGLFGRRWKNRLVRKLRAI